MKDKFIVEYCEENGSISVNVYKTYREIVMATGEEYMDVRKIHLMCNGTIIKKFLHPRLKKLELKMKINDI